MTNMTEVIDVDTDPMTAFTVFTDEFDQWWGRGPIDAYDTWRLVARRIEGGVGGRLVEDYGGEERVTGTITIWEPGARLAWATRNDVTIDVTFEARASGTASASRAPFLTVSTGSPSSRWCAWHRSGCRATSTVEPAAAPGRLRALASGPSISHTSGYRPVAGRGVPTRAHR